MKGKFLALMYSLRYLVSDIKPILKNIGSIILCILCIFVGFNLTTMVHNTDMPTQKKYDEYKSVVQQIADEGMRKVKLPNQITFLIIR